MDYARRELFKKTAIRVADQLYADIVAKRITKIGIGEIRALLQLEPCWRNALEFEELEKLTTRRIVEKVG